MATPNNSPRDLARLVYASLRNESKPPTIEVLEELFQVLFLTSLETEEGTSARCAVAFASGKRPDPDPPQRIRSHRWTYAPFANPFPLGVTSLAKLAAASDPDLCSLAVYPNHRGGLEVSGMFDQQAGFKALVRYEQSSGFNPPGLFQAEIQGLGHIVVTQGARILGELNAGQLVSESQDVFSSGPVRRALQGSLKRFCKSVRAVATKSGRPIATDPGADLFIAERWLQTLRRLLLRARAHGHGGAFLVNPTRSTKHLRVKHSFRYERLDKLLALAVGHGFVKEDVFELLHDDYMETESDTLPIDLYFEEVVADGEKEDAEEALSAAIGFVGSLSRVDGLVLMSADLHVTGFGVEITAPEIDVDVVSVRSGGSSQGKKIRLERFGTRHRSMFRYCAAHSGAVGFVLSEDGPVRAVLRQRNKVLLWDNVQLARGHTGG
jgi:hypothetical protein